MVLALLALTPIAVAQETNSLGMKLVPVPGTKILMATTEVTVDQYRAAGLGYDAPKFPQSGNHPAVNVSWNDAKAYCKWLSKKEGKKYRLPTDREWSCAVGIGNLESVGGSPQSKSGQVADVFPWGRQGKGSPPPKGAGNYPGQEMRSMSAEMAEKLFLSTYTLIGGYNDGQVFTAPVGSYAASKLGIHDLGGNASEWCEDIYTPGDPSRVLRGGSWNADYIYGLLYSAHCRDRLMSSYRNCRGPELRYDFSGFRVVCEER